MEGGENLEMVYIVVTRFKAGIYLSKAATEKKYSKKATVIKYDSYEQAKKKVFDILGDDFCHSGFLPNRLYSYRSPAIYIVIWTHSHVGFTDEDHYELFCKKNELSFSNSWQKHHLLYNEALRLTWQKGARTRLDPLLGRKNPALHVLYKRNRR